MHTKIEPVTRLEDSAIRHRGTQSLRAAQALSRPLAPSRTFSQLLARATRRSGLLVAASAAALYLRCPAAASGRVHLRREPTAPGGGLDLSSGGADASGSVRIMSA